MFSVSVMAENADACIFADAASSAKGVEIGDLERIREDIKEELSRISGGGGGGGTAKTHRRRRQAMRKKALGKGKMPYYVVTEAPSADGHEEEKEDHPSMPVINVRLHY